ncbi:MAG: outer membrane lipoprotein carrier protein LolA [Desulfobulbaceae bacterium]|nr:outer membrane lipoprotein carrier protein LolA [Desulfobulbaceae bacterium]
MTRVVLFITLLFSFCLAQMSWGAAEELKPIDLQSIQAHFVQEKHLKILSRPIVSTGSLTFQSPGSLRWEYLSPIRSILLMHGSKIKKFIERDGALIEEKGMRLDFMQFVLADIGSWLDGRFTENEMFEVAFAGVHTIVLTPKEEMLAGLISKIELTFATRKGLLNEVKIVEGADSYTTLTFKNRILNQEIPASIFDQK